VISGEQESKPYDSLVKNPVFSSNGEKVAYFAKSGKSVFLVLGGEESQIPFQSIGESVFSFDGNHFAYSASVSTTASVTSTAGTTTVVVPARTGKLVVLDGQEKALYQDVFGIAFSSDGNHLAYIAAKDGKKILVLDDREMDTDGEVYAGPQFSDDGKRVSYGAVINNEVWWKTEAVE
jgi:WD40 repeat protein